MKPFDSTMQTVDLPPSLHLFINCKQTNKVFLILFLSHLPCFHCCVLASRHSPFIFTSFLFFQLMLFLHFRSRSLRHNKHKLARIFTVNSTTHALWPKFKIVHHTLFLSFFSFFSFIPIKLQTKKNKKKKRKEIKQIVVWI